MADEETVALAAERVAEAEKALKEAQELHDTSETAQLLADVKAQHEAAKAEHTALTTVPEVKPEYGKHIFVDAGATGVPALRDAPKGWNRDRQLIVDGVNVEHVDEGEDGCWIYRRM